MKLIDLFSGEVVKLWNEWEVRAVIVISLLLQIILIIFGSQRKYRTGNWIKFVVWSAYMSADWVATVALGNLAKIQASNNERSSSKNYINMGLQTFWAPFLLLHLGGPDTITAYSLEDNELWSRHLLGLLVEVGVAFYVFFRSFKNTSLTYVFIPVFVAGIIKYGERTYALWSASDKQFKKDLLSTNLKVENAMRIAMGIKEEDLFEMELMEESAVISYKRTLSRKIFANNIEEAHFLFERLEYLFANMILPFNDRIECCNIIQRQKSHKKAFELVEIELGFMYDVLYSKANIYRTWMGFFLRIISFFASVSAIIAFSVVIHIHIDLHVYPLSDIFITLLLLAGAVFLEVYAFIVFLFSDWAKIYSVKKQIAKISSFCKSPSTKKRWSAYVAQYNLIDVCLAEIQTCKLISCVRKLPYVSKWIEECHYLSWEAVNDGMRRMIFEQLKHKAKKLEDNYSIKSCKELLARRGDLVPDKREEFRWCTINLEFDESLLAWHIATDISYHYDAYEKHDGDLHQMREISKRLSDYMLYLLFLCPSMLPKGIGELRYRDTCAQVKHFLKRQNKSGADRIDVCKMMLNNNISKGHITQSTLSDGCELAKQLRKETNCVKKWKMICDVWVEMLTYAASHCGWKEHGQQLWKGGELLTHVCVLMAHLGLSEQYNEKEHFYLV